MVGRNARKRKFVKKDLPRILKKKERAKKIKKIKGKKSLKKEIEPVDGGDLILCSIIFTRN